MTRSFVGFAGFLLIAGIFSSACAGEKFITIGTAGEMGIYYPTGGAICRLIKRGIKDHGIRCFVEITSGSIYNLKALRDGELDLAVAQTDWIHHAYVGTRDFEEVEPDSSLRALFSLHTEAFTVLARDDSKITNTRDLEHKRIGIGNDGSGMLATAQEFFTAEGWDRNSFAAVHEFKPTDLGSALCEGTVDAVLMTNGHPNHGTQAITSRCAVHMVSIEGKEIEKLIRDNPYYVHVRLPGGMYKGSLRPVNTFGVKAELVTTAKVDDGTIYQVVKAVFDDLDNFKTLHPVFASLDKSKMASEGLVVPLHPGAIKYYRETGLIK